MTAADIARVREHSSLAELAREHGLKLRKQPHGWTTRCVFHSDKTASLRLHTAGKFKGKYKCFGCSASGDCFDLVQHFDSCDLPTAIRSLAARAGIALSDRPETPSERRKREQAHMEREIADWYFRQEWKKARHGLNRAMTMGPEPIMDEFGLIPLDGDPQWNIAGQLAEFFGRRLRWIEANRGTADGLKEFRSSGVTERQYRQWLCVDLRRYAARVEFVAWVLDCAPPARNEYIAGK